MSGPDFETLLRSPLDDEPVPNGWGSAVLGLIGAGIAVLGLSFVLGLWTTTGENPPTTPAVDATADAPIERQSPYPIGFSDIGGSVAMKPVGAVTGEGGFTVSFSMVTSRGAEPPTTPAPLGGRWQLENSDGSVIGAARLVYDRAHTGIVGAAFPELPSEGDVLRMTERWDPDERTGSSDIPFTATPFTTTSAVSIDLGGDVALRLTRIDLGRHLGRILWSLSGTDGPRGVATFDVEIVDQNGETVGTYLSMPSHRDPTQSAGIVDLFWSQGFNVHPDDGSVVRIAATVQLVSPEPVDVVFDLASIPSG